MRAKLFKLIQKYPFLSKFIHGHDGYIPQPDSEKDYIFGAGQVDKIKLQADGQWTQYLPDDEVQQGRSVETMGCTGYSFLNIIEILAKRKWNLKWNKSDRYTNKETGTGPNGNLLRNVLDITMKKCGVVNESSWPWDKESFTWWQYYSPVDAKIKQLGADWLKEYKIAYEKVTTNKALMMNALKFGPLYVAGFAWFEQNGLYRSYGRANHAFVIVGYVEGSHWIAYDSYSPFIKKLAWDFLFDTCYLITIEKMQKEYNQSKINELLKRGFEYIMRTDKVNGGTGQVYKLTLNGLVELSEQEKLETGVKSLANQKDLTGISENDFYNLLK